MKMYWDSLLSFHLFLIYGHIVLWNMHPKTFRKKQAGHGQ